jgi:hypothetical protein
MAAIDTCASHVEELRVHNNLLIFFALHGSAAFQLLSYNACPAIYVYSLLASLINAWI